ncbi:transglutaminase domain-containing protein [Rufibacter sediminis]|uniref:Transglutaminase-like domain-containing protein n=1 Tax=Rufibacter sediminis TaxID=2762756 RepID=A0ABR6VY92_9BACT|nr:transglutaminase domain-containing protein [Rufibacter sediminis]MBC3542193.1 hypothetical protein [Rufibacter sediminis]
MARLASVFFFFLLCFQVFAQKTSRDSYAVPSVAPVIPAAQTKSVDGIAHFINRHYKTPQEKVQAIYQWLAANVVYDVQALSLGPQYYERQALITQTLATRKALCQGYAEVFHALCAQTGIPSYLITGFVVPRSTSTPRSHAWCAAQLDGQWYLFDPTWGAGQLENGTFVSRINQRYYMVPPARMVQTHLPFDPLWQFLPQPLTYEEFLSSKATSPRPKRTFVFLDSLAAYAAASPKAQLAGTIRRMEAHKMIPAVALEQLNDLRKNQAVIQHNETVDLFNQAVTSFNHGIDQLNQFTRYKNQRFYPVKPETELRKMTTSCTAQFQEAKRLLQLVKSRNNTQLLLPLENLNSQVENALMQAKSQEMFVTRYLKTPLKQRPALFYKQALAEKE